MKTIVLFLYLLYFSTGGIADELPGEELDPDRFFRHISSSVEMGSEKDDTSRTPREPRALPRLKWLDSVSQTWEAPPLSEQISNDTTAIRIGMGAIFVPSMSKSPEDEPEVYILDESGEVVVSGTTGRGYNLEPGTYSVGVGNIPKRPLIEDVVVEESKMIPVMPSWGGVRFEVINKDGTPIRGEYDMARMDPMTHLGRGRGRDITLAEGLSVWLLQPGTYKVVSPGMSFNTITNFITFRVKPGEFMNYTLVQEEATSTIVGGGILGTGDRDDTRSAWRHSLNFGGSADLSQTNNHLRDSVHTSLGLSLIFYDRSYYTSEQITLDNLLKFDVSLAVNRDELDNLTLTTVLDEMRFNTIFTYKLYERFGPYGRGEYVSGFVPSRVYANNDGRDADEKHFFLLYDERFDTLDTVEPREIDSLSESYQSKPAFSPLTIQGGIGGNVQLFRTPVINTRVLTGFGITYERRWDELGTLSDTEYEVLDSSSTFYEQYLDRTPHTILYNIDTERFNTGPEVMLQNTLNLGAVASVTTEFRAFAPVDRFRRPDITLSNLFSLHLLGNLVLDYDYTYRRVRADEEELRTRFSRHRVLLRFSLSR
ncbi:hypothetical protein [Chitinivibrio alkaliphilus]|uniref:Uncharacterized protein n=1 Tax=Chitinivibrio alkaliphilus ACht1 TaxID=1313304 RepID=U7D8R4_9BACT|nr:hypothetical protein [Chitinivibrio alkaliphilus]ERP31487.1 hypothetical protein CALK_1531 [Chitinivibrio alkaliphilus ACht1]